MTSTRVTAVAGQRKQTTFNLTFGFVRDNNDREQD